MSEFGEIVGIGTYQFKSRAVPTSDWRFGGVLDRIHVNDQLLFKVSLGFGDYSLLGHAQGFGEKVVDRNVQLLPHYLPSLNCLIVSNSVKHFKNRHLSVIADAYPDLHELDLSQSGVNDDGADALREFKSLATLRCDITQIGEKFIREAGRLPALKDLHVHHVQPGETSDNWLESIPIVGFPVLSKLSLLSWPSQISEKLASDIVKLPNLTDLTLGGDLSSRAAQILSKSKTIRNLEVDYAAAELEAHNPLWTMPSITSLHINCASSPLSLSPSNLQALHVSNARLDRQIHELPQYFPKLESLSLIDTDVSDKICENHDWLTRLTSLNLCSASVTDRSIPSLAGSEILAELGLSGCQIRMPISMNLNVSSSLSSLDLSQTLISDESLQHFRHCPNIEYLCLDETDISGEGLRFFESVDRLSTFQCHGAAIGNDVGRFLERAPLLSNLILSDTRVTSEVFGAISGCKYLTLIWLDGTDVSDQDFMLLSNLKELRILTLSGTKVTGRAREELRKALPWCTIL